MIELENDKNKSKSGRKIFSIELLKTFTKKELDQFNEFVSSTYFNKNTSLTKLLKLLRHYTLNTNGFAEDAQLKIYESVTGKAVAGKNLNKAQKKELSKLMNNLLLLAEDFLVIEGLKKQKDKKYDLLFPELIKRKQIDLHNKRLKVLENDLKAQKKRGTDYYTKQHKLQYHKANLLYIENKLAKEDNFDELQLHLDTKYILEKLGYHLAKITKLSVIMNVGLDFTPYKAIDKLLKLPQYASNPLIHLSLLNIDLIEKENDDTFIALSKAITEHLDIVPESFLKPFYTNLTNYCTSQIRKGKLSYYSDLFNIYKSMDNANILIMNNAMDVRLLKNIITNACRVKEYVWAKYILEKYIKNIQAKIRGSVINYNYGIIEFNQQKYKQALSYFNQVNKIDGLHEIGIKITTLKCFFEIDLHYEPTTQQAIDSRMLFFKKNQKLPESVKKGYANFIRIFNKLYKLKNIPNKRQKCLKVKKSIPAIKNELKNQNQVREKHWLLTKIATIGNECK